MHYDPQMFDCQFFDDFIDLVTPTTRYTVAAAGAGSPTATISKSRLVLSVDNVSSVFVHTPTNLTDTMLFHSSHLYKFKVSGTTTGLTFFVGACKDDYNNFVGIGYNAATGKLAFVTRIGGAAVTYADIMTLALGTEYIAGITVNNGGTAAAVNFGPSAHYQDYSNVTNRFTAATIPAINGIMPAARIEKTDVSAAVLSVDYLRFDYFRDV